LNLGGKNRILLVDNNDDIRDEFAIEAGEAWFHATPASDAAGCSKSLPKAG